MTMSELDEVILSGDASRCETFFQSMKESQRKELAPRALQWASALNGYVNRERPQFLVFDKLATGDIEFYRSIVSGKVVFPKDFKPESYPIARMSVLATCALPELKKTGLKALPEPEQAASILLARKPTWLDKWCAFVLKEAPGTHWRALRILEKNGVCSVEHNSAYWVSMLCSLSAQPGLVESVLTDDERLREEIWEMLADPGVARMLAEPEQIAHEIFRKRWNSGGDIFSAMQSGTRQGTEQWYQALIDLSDKGLIDRDRLIEYSFTSLAGVGEREAKKSVYQTVSTADFSIKLNQELTKEITATFASRYASLLKAAHKDVSTYASNVLADMPNQSLNVEDICAEIAPAFLNKSKDPADAALKLLGRLAKVFPEQRECYGPAIISAFSHSSKDIHKKALSLVESTRVLEVPEVLSEFLQRLDMIQGMERSKAMSLAEKYKNASDANSDFASDQSSSIRVSSHLSTAGSLNTLSESELFERSRKIDEKLRILACVDDAIEACKTSTVCDIPVNLDSIDYPRLDPATQIKPISSLDDLIYMFMKVWSGKCSSMELESVLDGVSRLCNQRPDDFQQKTDALRQKAEQKDEEFSKFGWTGTLSQVASSWLGNSRALETAGKTIAADPSSIFARRCLALAKRVVSKQPAPLLCAPTHAGGWIDPRVLVKRINEYFWIKLEPDKSDFIQALLRIAPEHRTQALESAASIKGEIGEALRYALGSGSMGKVITPEYWVAAFRARDPKGINEELRKILPKFGPDGPEPATYGLNISEVSALADDRYSTGRGGLPNFLPVESADPDFPISTAGKGFLQSAAHYTSRIFCRNRYAFFPTVLLHDNAVSWFAGTETYNWLHNRESLLALYAKRMLLNIDSVGSYWHGDFELLFDPDISLAENGRYFLCFAMSSKNNDLSRLAVDALIAAISERRISAAGYGEAMAQILPTGVITAVRWTRGLRDASRTSPLHAWFAWHSVAVIIEKAAINSTQQIPFLELLTEIQVEHGFKISDGLRGALSGITGAGKGAKLAKVLISSQSKCSNSALQASLQDLESRIARAERWQNWMRLEELAAANV